MPFTLRTPCHSELTIKKSRFIACVQAVDSREQALRIVQALRDEHPQATHVCWALMAGGQSAANDDGEPSGTAGRPMLEVLRHQDLAGVLATVVRYFGGVKLGAGGLVRAYSDAVAQAVLNADKQPVIAMAELRFATEYAHEGLVRRAIEAVGADLLAVDHGAQVDWHVRLPQAEATAWLDALADQCQGRLQRVPPDE
jgi:uncharacterized YigZ family protein